MKKKFNAIPCPRTARCLRFRFEPIARSGLSLSFRFHQDLVHGVIDARPHRVHDSDGMIGWLAATFNGERNRRMAEKANARQIAKVFGVHTSTVISWVERGCPYDSKEILKKKTRWVFDIDDVKSWREKELARLDLMKEPSNRVKPPQFSKEPASELEGRFRRLLGF